MQDFLTFINRHPALSLMTLAIIILLIIVELFRLKRGQATINSTQLIQLMNHQQAVVMDIRSKDEFKMGHIIGAMSAKTEEITQQPKKWEKYKNRPLIIVCQSGIESKKLAANLSKQGYNTVALQQGMRGWKMEGLPIVKE